MSEAKRNGAADAWEHATLIEALGASSLFCGLAHVQLGRLTDIGSIESFSRNTFIFREGDSGDRFYVILNGAVRISRQVPGMGEEALAILRSGSAFGEMSIIDDSPRSADALAHEACDLFVVPKEDLEDLLFVDRALASDVLWKLVRILSDRLRATNDKMTFLSASGRFE